MRRLSLIERVMSEAQAAHLLTPQGFSFCPHRSAWTMGDKSGKRRARDKCHAMVQAETARFLDAALWGRCGNAGATGASAGVRREQISGTHGILRIAAPCRSNLTKQNICTMIACNAGRTQSIAPLQKRALDAW
jgi:hypothetical protein